MAEFRKPALALGAGAVLTLLSTAAPAADPGRGQMLYQNHCRGCHQSTVHVRARSKAGSPAELRSQIERWRRHLKLGWGAEELADVFAHLNRRYYRFEKR